MTLFNSDTFQFWHFPFLTLSNSDTFQFWHLPILTLSNSDTFRFWHFPILKKDAFWHFPILTLSSLPENMFLPKSHQSENHLRDGMEFSQHDMFWAQKSILLLSVTSISNRTSCRRWFKIEIKQVLYHKIQIASVALKIFLSTLYLGCKMTSVQSIWLYVSAAASSYRIFL